jgi:hypothetical protein
VTSGVRWIPFFPAQAGLPALMGAQEITYQHVVVDAKYPKRVHRKAVGDINSDGYPDLAGANHGNRGVPTPVEVWSSQPGHKAVR